MSSSPEASLPSDASIDLSSLSINPQPHLISVDGAKWETHFSAYQGRYLVAKSDFKAGDLVVEELPFAFVPFDGPRAQVRAL